MKELYLLGYSPADKDAWPQGNLVGQLQPLDIRHGVCPNLVMTPLLSAACKLPKKHQVKFLEYIKGHILDTGKNHRRYNEILKLTYPDLVDVEGEMEADYRAFQKRSLKWRLAYTAGFETMTMGITEWLIRQRGLLFAGADSSVSSLVLWHMVEETEHKNVAYDLYMHLYGDWRGKAWGLICGAAHVAWCSRKAYRRMLKRDGKWYIVLSRLRLYATVGRFALHTSPAMLRSLLPGYHPANVTDPEWVLRWASAYDGLEQGSIPLLDTSDPEIPARFHT